MSDVIERIKDALDIVSYIQRHVPGLKKAGRHHKACCCFHNEKTPSLVVNADTQQWRCYGSCATGGDIFNFAMKLHNWTFPEALQELAKEAGVTLPRNGAHKAERETDERLLGLLKTAADLFHHHLYADTPASRAALTYARDTRGLTDETLKSFQIGYAPQEWSWLKAQLLTLGYSEKDLLDVGLLSKSDKDPSRTYDTFRHRLIFPITDAKGVRGFGGRAMDGQEPKYLNSKQSSIFDKSRLLYAYPQAKRAIETAGYAVIVEGYMDTVTAHQAGYTNIVGQMGTALTGPQLDLLGKVAKRLLFALDQDGPGKSALLKNMTELYQAGHASRLEMDLRVMSWDDGKDPDELIRTSPDAWTRAVTDARSALDVILDTACANTPHSAPVPQKQAVLRGLAGVLNGLDILMRREALDGLAERLGLREGDVTAWVQMQASVQGKATPTPIIQKPATNAPIPTLELIVLHGILVNDDQRWLDRANATLQRMETFPNALAPLSLNDFSHSHTRALMSLVMRAVEQGIRPFDDEVKEQVEGGPLFDAYIRATCAPNAKALFAAETSQGFTLNYEAFIQAVTTLRRVRLESDLASQMLVGDQIVEWARAREALCLLSRVAGKR